MRLIALTRPSGGTSFKLESDSLRCLERATRAAMQDLSDVTNLDDSAMSLEPANWTCCACTCENKPSFLVCEVCYSERPAPAAPDGRAVQEEDEAIDKWECSTCTFKNEPLLLCCSAARSATGRDHLPSLKLSQHSPAKQHSRPVQQRH
jgi:hypothetical protein